MDGPHFIIHRGFLHDISSSGGLVLVVLGRGDIRS